MKPARFLPRLAFPLALTVLPGIATACSDDRYVGSVCVVVQNWCPDGFVPADGSTLQVNQYQALFSLIGYAYGGNNTNTFAVPDLRGRAIIGTGQGVGLSSIAFAQKVGQQQVTLAPNQTPMPAHTHPATFTPTQGSASVTIPATSGNLAVSAALPVSTSTGNVSGTTVGLPAGQNGYLASMRGASGPDAVTFTGPYTTSAPAGPTAQLPAQVTVTGTPGTPATTATVTTVTGGTVTVGASNTVPATAPVPTQSPALGMTVCIATQGLYPTRP